MKNLDHSALLEALNYDPETGVFTWLISPAKNVKCGSVAGYRQSRGYHVIRVGGRMRYAHRLAWLYMTGNWPSNEIDHINGDRFDNRFSNLREANRYENQRNIKAHKDNASGIKGVWLSKDTNLWRSGIQINGKLKMLGSFKCPTAAHFAYCKAAKLHYGQFARTK